MPSFSQSPTAGSGRPRRCCKRRPVVAADRLRQPVLAQQPLDHRPHASPSSAPRSGRPSDSGCRHRSPSKDRNAPVPGAEPALEVDAPGVVGRLNRRKGRGQRHRPSGAGALPQSLPPQQIADRAGRRPAQPRMAPLQHRPQLARAPSRPLRAARPRSAPPDPQPADAAPDAAHANGPTALPPDPPHGAPPTCIPSCG